MASNPIKSKKGIMISTIITIILLLVGFFIIFKIVTGFFGKAESETAEAICKTSIVARESSKVDIAEGIIETKPSPFLCKTQEITIPKKDIKNKDAEKQQVMKEIADKMARCWWMFGEGLITEALDPSLETKNKCFMCYAISVEKKEYFNEPISATDFSKYLLETPYIVKPDSKDSCKDFAGECVSISSKGLSEQEKSEGWKIDEENSVCIKKYLNMPQRNCKYNKYDCINKGGLCLASSNDDSLALYKEWSCKKGTNCYIKKENFYSYVDYVQQYGGPGRIVSLIEDIRPGETYAIMYGDRTESCGWCTSFYGGATTLSAMGVTAGLIMIIEGVAGSVASGGLSLGLVAAGAKTFGVSLGLGILSGENAEKEIYKFFQERDVATIYIMPLNQASEVCSRQAGIGEDDE